MFHLSNLKEKQTVQDCLYVQSLEITLMDLMARKAFKDEEEISTVNYFKHLI